MGKYTPIAWADACVNVWYGCRKVDADPRTGACYGCYLWRNLPRYGYDPDVVTYLSLDNAIKRAARYARDPDVKRVFLENYGDLFHEDVPFEKIDEVVERLILGFPRLQWLCLTKRIGRAMVYWRRRRQVPDNVWMGCTIGAKNRLWRLGQLRQIPASVRWVSFEPLLEDLGDFSLRGIQWAVVGGESDLKNPRPMKPEWAENIKKICERDAVAFFFKQWGGRGRDGAGGDVWLDGKRYQRFPLVTKEKPAERTPTKDLGSPP